MLTAVPMAEDDPWYSAQVNTPPTIGSSDRTLLENDWDPQGASPAVSVVGEPAHGSLSNFDSNAGTFTYTPDTDFAGFDSFTYQVTNGESLSNTATVSIAVGGHFGPQTNQEDPDVFRFMQPMEPEYVPGSWSDGDYLSGASNFGAGFGDTLTFGGTHRIREWAGINGGIDTTSWLYFGGSVTGTAINVYLSGGAGLARTPAVARIIARVYTTTDIAVARVQWGHRVLTGQATVMDALPLARLRNYLHRRASSSRNTDWFTAVDNKRLISASNTKSTERRSSPHV